jgi:predicted Zn-dependent protease
VTATQLAPQYPNAYFGLAAACDGLERADEAAQHRRKFRELQAAQLRQSIEQTGRYDDVSSTRQDIADCYLAAGRLYLESGDESAAEQHAKRALELAPDNEQGRAELAGLYARTGRLREAVDVLLPLKKTRAEDASFWQRLAQLYAQMQAFEEADESLRRMVKLTPEQAVGYAAQAQLRLQLNRDPAEAAGFAKQAVERAPTAANYFLWSVACQRSGDRPQAQTAIAKALELDPGNAQYQQLYLSLGAKR